MSATQSKLVEERHRKQLVDLVMQAGNDQCADCKARAPRWASYSIGIFLCVHCATIHRKMGTHISKVKSLTMDSWSREQIDVMRQVGNIKSNQLLNPNEARNPPPTNLEDSERDSELEKYIRSKYEFKRFIDRSGTQRTGPPQSSLNTPPMPTRAQSVPPSSGLTIPPRTSSLSVQPPPARAPSAQPTLSYAPVASPQQTSPPAPVAAPNQFQSPVATPQFAATPASPPAPQLPRSGTWNDIMAIQSGPAPPQQNNTFVPTRTMTMPTLGSAPTGLYGLQQQQQQPAFTSSPSFMGQAQQAAQMQQLQMQQQMQQQQLQQQLQQQQMQQQQQLQQLQQQQQQAIQEQMQRQQQQALQEQMQRQQQQALQEQMQRQQQEQLQRQQQQLQEQQRLKELQDQMDRIKQEQQQRQQQQQQQLQQQQYQQQLQQHQQQQVQQQQQQLQQQQFAAQLGGMQSPPFSSHTSYGQPGASTFGQQLGGGTFGATTPFGTQSTFTTQSFSAQPTGAPGFSAQPGAFGAQQTQTQPMQPGAFAAQFMPNQQQQSGTFGWQR